MATRHVPTDGPPPLISAFPVSNSHQQGPAQGQQAKHVREEEKGEAIAPTQAVVPSSQLVDIASLVLARGYSLNDPWGLLVCEHGSHTCTFEKTSITVGRSSLCDVVVDDPRVSAVHFTLTVEAELYHLPATAAAAPARGLPHSQFLPQQRQGGRFGESGECAVDPEHPHGLEDARAATAVGELMGSPTSSTEGHGRGPSSLKVETGGGDTNTSPSEASPTLSSTSHGSPPLRRAPPPPSNPQHQTEGGENAYSPGGSPEPPHASSPSQRSATAAAKSATGADGTAGKRRGGARRSTSRSRVVLAGGGVNAVSVTASLAKTTASPDAARHTRRPGPLTESAMDGEQLPSRQGDANEEEPSAAGMRFTTLASPTSHRVLSAVAESSAPLDGMRDGGTSSPPPPPPPQAPVGSATLTTVTVIRVVLEDVSTNGTYINDIRVGKGRRKELMTGDDIAIVRIPEKQSRDDREAEEHVDEQHQHQLLLLNSDPQRQERRGLPGVGGLESGGDTGTIDGGFPESHLTALLARLPASRTYLEHFCFHLYPKAQLPVAASTGAPTPSVTATALTSLANTPAIPSLAVGGHAEASGKQHALHRHQGSDSGSTALPTLGTLQRGSNSREERLAGALALPTPSSTSAIGTSTAAAAAKRASGSMSVARTGSDGGEGEADGPRLDRRGFFIPVPTPSSQSQQQQRSLSATPHSLAAAGSSARMLSPPPTGLVGSVGDPSWQAMAGVNPREGSLVLASSSSSAVAPAAVTATPVPSHVSSTPVRYNVMPMRDLQWGARIGSGASGDVFTGIDVESGMLIAIKVLKGTANIGGWSEPGMDSSSSRNNCSSENDDNSSSSASGTHQGNARAGLRFGSRSKHVNRRALQTLSTDEDFDKAHADVHGQDEDDNESNSDREMTPSRGTRRAKGRGANGNRSRTAKTAAANPDDTILSLSDVSATGCRSPMNMTMEARTPPQRLQTTKTRDSPKRKRSKTEHFLMQAEEEARGSASALIPPPPLRHAAGASRRSAKRRALPGSSGSRGDAAHRNEETVEMDESGNATGTLIPTPHKLHAGVMATTPKIVHGHRHEPRGHTGRPMLIVEKDNVRHYVRMPRGIREAHLRELWFLTQLQHHRIVRCLGFQAVRHRGLCILMEYVAGGTLQSLVKSFGAFEENVIRLYALQILEGLEYLASCFVVHGDLKSANVLVSERGNVKLTDFGTSKILRDCNMPRMYRFRRASRQSASVHREKREGKRARREARSGGGTAHPHEQQEQSTTPNGLNTCEMAAQTTRGPNDTICEEEEDSNAKSDRDDEKEEGQRKGRENREHTVSSQGAGGGDEEERDGSLNTSPSRDGEDETGDGDDSPGEEEEEEEELLEGGRVLCGTPLYMSPELIRTQVSTAASDVWALGCVVYEMATGGILPWREVHQADPPTIILHIGRHYDNGPSLQDLYAARVSMDEDMRQELRRRHGGGSGGGRGAQRNARGKERSGPSASRPAPPQRSGEGIGASSAANEEVAAVVTPSSSVNAAAPPPAPPSSSSCKLDPVNPIEPHRTWSNEEEEGETRTDEDGKASIGSALRGGNGNHRNLSRDSTPRSAGDSAASASTTPASAASVPLTPSPMLVDFIQSMFIMDPQRRPSAADLLRHPFITCTDGPTALERWHRSIGDIDLNRQQHFRHCFPAVPLASSLPAGAAGRELSPEELMLNHAGQPVLPADEAFPSFPQASCVAEAAGAPVDARNSTTSVSTSKPPLMLSSEDWRAIRAGSVANHSFENEPASPFRGGVLRISSGSELPHSLSDHGPPPQHPLHQQRQDGLAQGDAEAVATATAQQHEAHAAPPASLATHPAPPSAESLGDPEQAFHDREDRSDAGRREDGASGVDEDASILPGPSSRAADAADGQAATATACPRPVSPPPPVVLSGVSQPDSQPLFAAPQRPAQPPHQLRPQPQHPQRVPHPRTSAAADLHEGPPQSHAPPPLLPGSLADEQLSTPPLRPSPRTPLVQPETAHPHPHPQQQQQQQQQHGVKAVRPPQKGVAPHAPQQAANGSPSLNYSSAGNHAAAQPPQPQQQQQQAYRSGRPSATKMHKDYLRMEARRTLLGQPSTQPEPNVRPSSQYTRAAPGGIGAQAFPIRLPHSHQRGGPSTKHNRQQQQQQPRQQQQSQSVMGGEGVLGDTGMLAPSVHHASAANPFVVPLYQSQGFASNTTSNGGSANPFLGEYSYNSQANSRTMMMAMPPLTWHVAANPSSQPPPPLPRSRQHHQQQQQRGPLHGGGRNPANAGRNFRPPPQQQQPSQQGRRSPRVSPSSLKQQQQQPPPQGFPSRPPPPQMPTSSPILAFPPVPMPPLSVPRQSPTGLTFDFSRFHISPDQPPPPPPPQQQQSVSSPLGDPRQFGHGNSSSTNKSNNREGTRAEAVGVLGHLEIPARGGLSAPSPFREAAASRHPPPPPRQQQQQQPPLLSTPIAAPMPPPAEPLPSALPNARGHPTAAGEPPLPLAVHAGPPASPLSPTGRARSTRDRLRGKGRGRGRSGRGGPSAEANATEVPPASHPQLQPQAGLGHAAVVAIPQNAPPTGRPDNRVTGAAGAPEEAYEKRPSLARRMKTSGRRNTRTGAAAAKKSGPGKRKSKRRGK